MQTVLLVICIVIIAILLIHIVLMRVECRGIIKKIRSIRSKDTNELVHITTGTIPPKLINEINGLLKDIRRYDMEYVRKSHDLEQMMTNISHDLRTPLTSAMGYISIIKEGTMSDAECGSAIEIVDKRLKRLEELINSFFEFSMIISSGKVPERAELNLNTILEEAIVHYFDDYSMQNRMVELRNPAGRIKLVSNRNVLMRVFDNLVGNALKHGVGDLIVTVTDGDVIKISFENGIDDPELDVSRIFDEFYTTDISRTKGNTGLGLAIAKQFTELIGGKISAHSSDGRFCIDMELPK